MHVRIGDPQRGTYREFKCSAQSLNNWYRDRKGSRAGRQAVREGILDFVRINTEGGSKGGRD